MRKRVKGILSALLLTAGVGVAGVAWATCCLDSGQCKHNPHTMCGTPINDYFDWCSTGECCRIRVYQCYPGDTCRARDTSTPVACPPQNPEP
jgi:hypothetical protein